MNQIIDEHFKDHKHQALKRLESAITDNKVDPEIIALLETMNSCEQFFTTSSCAGRIVVLQLPEIGNKKKAIFLGRWHRQVQADEVIVALQVFNKDQVWLIMQPPIFHIGCKNLDAATKMMNIGFSSGFKHSGIRSIAQQITVELQSTERMDIPIGRKGEQIISDELFPFFCDIANNGLKRAKKKLHQLEKKVELID